MTLARSPFAVAVDLLFPEPDPDRERIEADYETWLQVMFGGYAKYPLAPHHHAIWEWVWRINIDSRPEALVAIINRGGAKSTTAELAVVAMGARGTRKYVLYVCETQEQADDHVQNIAAMLESATVEQFYPELGEKLVGKHGNSKGWRRNRLRTSTGFTVDALGLDTAARGIKLEDQRPDQIVLDDIDGKHDTAKTTAKKIDTITAGLLPAGSENVAVLAVQNLIHANSIFAKLANGEADFFMRKTVVGPIPGYRDFSYRQRPDGTYEIVTGDPTWRGFDIERGEALLNLIGPRAFLTEVQHEVNTVEGAIANGDELQATRVLVAPSRPVDVIRTIVVVDPAVSNNPSSDETGITVSRLGFDRHVYLLADVSCRVKVDTWADRAVAAAVEWNAGAIWYEPNQGGDAIESALRHAMERAGVTDVVIRPIEGVSKSKFDRALSLQDAIRAKRWHLVGHFPELEHQIKTTTADMMGPSPDRLDSAVHGVRILSSNSDPHAMAMLAVKNHAGESVARTADILNRKF